MTCPFKDSINDVPCRPIWALGSYSMTGAFSCPSMSTDSNTPDVLHIYLISHMYNPCISSRTTYFLYEHGFQFRHIRHRITEEQILGFRSPHRVFKNQTFKVTVSTSQIIACLWCGWNVCHAWDCWWAANECSKTSTLNGRRFKYITNNRDTRGSWANVLSFWQARRRSFWHTGTVPFNMREW